MSKFIEGGNRHQITLFPESVDDFVPEDSPVRVVDMFIDRLDISGLGFKAEPAETPFRLGGKATCWFDLDSCLFRTLRRALLAKRASFS